MKVMIAKCRGNSFDLPNQRRTKLNSNKFKFSKNLTKEVMSISKVEPVRIIGKPKLEDKKSVLSRMRQEGVSS